MKFIVYFPGYTTKSILCVPIINKNEVQGVVEMINKKGGGSFKKADQNYFESFSVFCGLALRNAKVSIRGKLKFRKVLETDLELSRWRNLANCKKA